MLKIWEYLQQEYHVIQWGTVADWLVALATFVLAAVAVFQETIRGCFYRPVFQVSIKTEPPDCVAIPFTDASGIVIADSIYLRLWVKNIGNATAKNAEVYASELRRQRLEGTWDRVRAFPPMNLKWSNIGTIYFPRIAPKMGKYCDIGHISDPERRHLLREDAPSLHLGDQQTSLAFDLMAAPNNRSHIIGPGEYQLDILIAAENARPIKRTVAISLRGTWDSDETTMLRDYIGIAVLP
jgi:hypothetical protein